LDESVSSQVKIDQETGGFLFWDFFLSEICFFNILLEIR
jgi:hypothetical protein